MASLLCWINPPPLRLRRLLAGTACVGATLARSIGSQHDEGAGQTEEVEEESETG